jgi:outer membrane protein OmpA-like peptidoglycan-associated protein
MRTQASKSAFGLVSVLGLLAGSLPAGAEPIADVDPPALESIDETTNIKVVPPTMTMQGTRGLSQTASAEALGEGRLVLGVHGPWYRQERQFQGVPNAEADIFTGVGTISYGISRQFDIFASLTGYGSQNYSSDNPSGLGTIGGGIQATLPFSPSAPLRMGAEFAVFNGISKNPINSNYSDGYNYFETRTGLDFRGHLIQTLVTGSEDAAIKVHFNEGLVTSAEDGVDPLLLLATGVQFNLPVAALGIELHSRTALNNVDLQTDPLWVTPSLQFRTAYNLNLSLGGDISLSKDRPDPSAQRALEPFRLFGGLAFTFDTQAEKRRQEKMEAWRVSQEKARLKARNEELARRAQEDSLNAANASAQSEADKAAMAEKARQDSLASAAALADARKKLQDEMNKRSDLEKQLLSTGLLVMDAVYFETGKTDISINSKPYLNMLAKMLVKYPKLQIEVAGHTDNVGSDAYNMNLSQGRAMSVMAYMQSQQSDLAGRLTAKGYGESMAKADNTTAEGRKLNRRTELQVLNKDALREYNEPAVQAAAPQAE